MAYDHELAHRLREALQGESELTEKPMFGGLAFLIGGNLAVSASGQGGLLLRIDPTETAALTQDPHAHPFVMRGRAMNGWLRIDPEALETFADLERWVSRGVARARALAPK
ncbi:MAG: methyltransferase [Frankiales bacterium]|jgi:hypothetical protein|nr:methyltransferase [Frankiales bacterium]